MLLRIQFYKAGVTCIIKSRHFSESHEKKYLHSGESGRFWRFRSEENLYQRFDARFLYRAVLILLGANNSAEGEQKFYWLLKSVPVCDNRRNAEKTGLLREPEFPETDIGDHLNVNQSFSQKRINPKLWESGAHRSLKWRQINAKSKSEHV